MDKDNKKTSKIVAKIVTDYFSTCRSITISFTSPKAAIKEKIDKKILEIFDQTEFDDQPTFNHGESENGYSWINDMIQLTKISLRDGYYQLNITFANIGANDFSVYAKTIKKLLVAANLVVECRTIKSRKK